MRRVIVILFSAALFAAAQSQPAINPPSHEDMRLPNGKSQRDAILKADYEKSLEDSRDLVKLAEDLKTELEKNDYMVVSVSEIRKTEEIEKLAHRIRGRLKR